MVGQVVGQVAQKAAKKGIEKLFQQLLKNKIQKEGIASISRGITKPTRKSIGELTAINQGSPAFQNRVGFVENYFKNNKIETLDDLNLLFDNLRNPKVNKMLDPNLTVEGVGQGKFPPYEGQIKDMGTNLKNVIRWSNMSDKMKTTYTNKISDILRQKARDVSHVGRTEIDYKNFENNLSNIKSIMEKDKTKSFVDAFKEAVSEVKSTRSGFRKQTWDYWTKDRLFEGKLTSGRLQKENPDLYNFFKDIIKVPKVEPRGSLTKEYGKTPYDYIKAFTQRDNPEMYNMLFTKDKNGKIVQKPILQKIFGEKFLRQMHLMGENLGSTTVANLKDLVSKYEMIPKEFVNLIRRPQYIGTPKMNSEHLLIEMGRTKGEKGLIDLLVDKFDVMGYNWTKNKKGPGGTWNPISTKEKLSKSDIEKIKEINVQIKAKEKALRDLGLESVFYDPSKKNLVYFGGEFVKDVKTGIERFVSPKDANLMKLRKEYLAGNRKDGGLINDPLTAMMNSGGFMDYGEMKPVAPLLDPGERQYLQLGGKAASEAAKAAAKAGVKYIKKQVLPKVIGHTTKIMEKLAAPKDAPKVIPKPWAVFDEKGNPIIDFRLKKDADLWLKQEKGSTPAGDDYYTKTLNYKVAPKETVTATAMEETPAMVWKSPEIIANAPMEIAQGKQWNGILKKAGVSPKELDDTSLGPFLEIQHPDKKFTKAQLLEEFNNLAPKIEVLATGKRDQGKYLTNILTKFNSVRDSISDFSGKDQSVLNNFAGILEKVAGAKTDTQLNVLANQTNKLMKQAYGINNALISDQIPTTRQIPAPIRSIFGDMQELFKTRGAAHKFDKRPSHASDQVLPGGVNYREYAFTYTPNQLRSTEPIYNPSSHTFGFADDVIKNMFVHTRISDRTDNFGRKLIFVEEIQSDMHQRPQKAIREGRDSGYATRKDKILSAQTYIDEMAVLQNKIDAILAREPNHASLPALYKQRGTLSDKIEKIRTAVSGGGDMPEGPFQRSEDYGSFVMKYLLRLAKEGNYDGVAVSTGNIKNRKGYGPEERQKGHYGFYDKIMQKVMKKIAKNVDLEYNRTVINDGAVNWGNVPILILKEADKVMKGLPSFREGGLNRENFVDVVPLL
jgi:hypothetical protein